MRGLLLLLLVLVLMLVRRRRQQLGTLLQLEDLAPQVVGPLAPRSHLASSTHDGPLLDGDGVFVGHQQRQTKREKQETCTHTRAPGISLTGRTCVFGWSWTDIRKSKRTKNTDGFCSKLGFWHLFTRRGGLLCTWYFLRMHQSGRGSAPRDRRFAAVFICM